MYLGVVEVERSWLGWRWAGRVSWTCVRCVSEGLVVVGCGCGVFRVVVFSTLRG